MPSLMGNGHHGDTTISRACTLWLIADAERAVVTPGVRSTTLVKNEITN